MRALIIISASRAMVMDPSRTWATNSFTRFLPRSLAAGSAPKRPSSTIWSRSPFSRTCSPVPTDPGAPCGSAIGTFPLSHFLLQLVQLFGVANGFQQRLLQFVISLQAAAQIGQPRAQVQQFLERFHLARHIFRVEIVHGLEMQIDLEVGGIRLLTELVLHGER